MDHEHYHLKRVINTTGDLQSFNKHNTQYFQNDKLLKLLWFLREQDPKLCPIFFKYVAICQNLRATILDISITELTLIWLKNYLIWCPYLESSFSPSIADWCCDSKMSRVCPMGWLLASIPSSLESQELISCSFLANCSLSDAIAVHSLFRDNTRCCK